MISPLKVSESKSAAWPSGRGAGRRPLRALREKRGVHQPELASRMGISRRKLQRIEAKKFHELSLGEIRLFAEALGERYQDVLELVEAGCRDGGIVTFCLDQFKHVTSFEEGKELRTLVSEEGRHWIGLVHLEPGKSFAREHLPYGHFIFGLVLKGTLLIDDLRRERVLKERDCFRFAGSMSFEMCNTHSLHKLSVLLFSVQF